MKILHTSDWHLGHTLYNYDRAEEQMAMLLQMVDIVRIEQPDVFLLCGDVYHTAQPSAAVQTMFTNALMEIHQAQPEMKMVIIAGNHDSGTKHEIFRTAWKALAVETIGCVDDDSLDDLVIEVKEKGYVIAVPYVNQRNLPKGLYQQLIDMVVARNHHHLPIIMMTHTTVRGCDYAGHENSTEQTVGGIDSCDLQEMGTGYDYLALGHIHHAQFVHGGAHRVRYSGSPLPISFDENYSHTISIIEIDRHVATPMVREVPITVFRPLVTLPTHGFVAWKDAKELLEQFPDDNEAYIRLNVEIDHTLPVEANAEAMMIAENKKCRFCLINTKRTATKNREPIYMSVQEFRAEEPIDIAEKYADDMGVEFDSDMKRLFKETLDALEEEKRM